MSFDPSLPDDSVNVSDRHPLREAAWLFGGIAAAVLALAAVAGLAVDAVVGRLPPGLEVRLFELAGLDPSAGGEADPRRAAVQSLLDRLSEAAGPSPYEYRARILELPEPNALAIPGGFVAVTDGLLESVESENELAFVLGHELGHFRNRDHLRGLGRELSLAVVAAALGVGGAAEATELAGLAARLGQRSFDRRQELAADAVGLELLAALYGHAGGATGFFRLLPDPGEGLGTEASSYLSTHPLSEDRVEEIRELARRRGIPTDGPLTPLDL